MNEAARAEIHNDDLVPLRDGEFTYIANLVYERFGIHLADQKKILVAGRLSKRLRQLGCPTFRDYIDYLESDSSGTELSEMMNRLTTNHSFFFREPVHFEFLSDTILPALERDFSRMSGYPLRVWSAGCASGEEVYSVAMLLHDRYGAAQVGPDIGLLATDISLAALGSAREAVYGGQKFGEMPMGFRQKYLRKANDGDYAIAEEIRQMVLFKRLNLMADRFPMKGQFDLILCRNVMIYFDQDSRNKVVKSLYEYVKPGGYLFIGHSETLNRETNPFEYVKSAIYRKGIHPERPAARGQGKPAPVKGANR